MAGRPSSQNPRRKKCKLPAEICERLQKSFKQSLRGMPAEKVFRKFDKDKSGELSKVEFIRLVRLQLRIGRDSFSDSDIQALIAALDDDGTGCISIEELLDFVERGQSAFYDFEKKRIENSAPQLQEELLLPAPRYGWLQGEVLRGTGSTATPVAQIDLMSPEICDYLIASMGFDPTTVYAAFFGSPVVSAPSAPTSGGDQVVKTEHAKPQRAPINEEVARRLQLQLKGATLHRSLESILRKFDKDKSGSLSGEELRRLIRLELRLPDTTLSDKDINALVLALDDDGSRTLSISELVDFVEFGSATFFADNAETQKHVTSTVESDSRKSNSTSPNGHPRIRRAAKAETSDWDGAVVVFPVKKNIVCTTPDINTRKVNDVPSHIVTPRDRPASAASFQGTRISSPATPRPHSSAEYVQMQRLGSPVPRRPNSAAAAFHHKQRAAQSSPLAAPVTARPHSSTGFHMSELCAAVSTRPHSSGGHYWNSLYAPTSPASRPVSGRYSPLTHRTTRPASAPNGKSAWY